MSTEAGRVYVPVQPDASGFQSRLAGKINSALSSIGAKATAWGRTMTKTVTLPVIAALGYAVKSFMEAEKVTAQTEAVIKSTGGVAGVTAKHINALATRLQNLSGISGETIGTGANLLLTFTNIRNEVGGKFVGVFDQAIKTATDMSVALGQDMKSSAIQPGKALNDPKKGITALQRVGVSFSEQQKKRIEDWIEEGKVVRAQKFILAELNKEFGGSAKAMGETLSGQLSIAKEKFGDFAENIGAVIAPYVVDFAGKLAHLGDKLMALDKPTREWIIKIALAVAAIGPALVVIGKMATGLSGLISVGSKLVPLLGAMLSPVGLVVAAVAALAAGLVYAYQKSESFRAAVQAAVQWLQTNALPMVKAFVDGVVQGFRALVEFVTPFVKDLVAFVGSMWQELAAWTKKHWDEISEAVGHVLKVIQTAIQVVTAAIKTWWSTWGDEVLQIAKNIWNAIKSTVKNALHFVQGIIQTVMAVINGDWGKAWEGIKKLVGAIWDQIKNVISTALGIVGQVVEGALSTLRLIWDNTLGKVVSLVKDAFGKIVDTVSNRASDVVDFMQKLPGRIVKAIGNLGHLLWDAGKAIIMGLWNGAKSVVSGFLSWLGDLKNSILDAFTGIGDIDLDGVSGSLSVNGGAALNINRRVDAVLIAAADAGRALEMNTTPQQVTNHYTVETVQVDGLRTIQDVEHFFGKIKQTARQGVPTT